MVMLAWRAQVFLVVCVQEETCRSIHPPGWKLRPSIITSTNDSCNLCMQSSRISFMLGLILLSDSSYLAIRLTFFAA
jgi:hypothetical protein